MTLGNMPANGVRSLDVSCWQLTCKMGATMTDDELKKRTAEVMATPEAKAIIEKGRKFSHERQQMALDEVLAENADSDQIVGIRAFCKALMARWVH
jgi:1,2-phenylacetyl-CoA epoxidase PaaB subunit